MQDGDLDAASVCTSPADFAQHFSDGRWQSQPHLRIIADAIADAVMSQQGQILILEAPPRHGKSELVSHWLPAWYLSLWPERRVILTSYGAQFAEEWGRKVRDTLNEIATCQLARDSQAAERWHTVAGGSLQTAGVGGPLTGKGANLFIIDDPIKNAEEADSETYRERLWNWWQSVAWTRREPGTVYVIMHTRWHEDDLVGRILGHEEMVKLTSRIRLPAIAEDEDDALGRAKGEPLWPSRYPLEGPDGLLTTKATMTARWWQAMFQQRPAAAEGAEIKRQWWKWYDELPVIRERLEFVVSSWDCTFKDVSTSDYVVGQVWGIYGAYRYLLDVVRERMDVVETERAIVALQHKWSPNATLVELAGNGDAIVAHLRNQVPGLVGIEVRGKGSKVARARAISPQIEGGQVWLPKGKKFADELVEEAAAFPLGKYDDQVDALSQALSFCLDFKSTLSSDMRASQDRFVPHHVLEERRRRVFGGFGLASRKLRKI